jgi:hypothetical protein
MKISKRLLDLINIYGITQEEVIYSILCAAGLPKYEAYYIAIRPREIYTQATLTARAQEMESHKANISKCITAFRLSIPKNLQEMREPERTKGGKIKKPTKENLNKLLTEIISRGDDKQKLEGIKALNTLNQLNKEQTNEEERVHYYLPRLECANCPFLSGKDEKK